MQADLLRHFYDTESTKDFDAFARAWEHWILRVAYRTIDRGTPNRELIAEEVKNEILQRLHEMSPKQRWSPEVGPLEKWLGTLVRNYVMDRFRSATRRRKRQQEYSDQFAGLHVEPHVEKYRAEQQRLEDREILPRVMAEVHALPPICQAMLCLRFIEEKSYPEIGNLLGMNNQKVRRDTLKLVAALRRQFPDDGGCAA